MAKIERNLKGDFDEFLQAIETEILEGSISATRENSSDFQKDAVRCAVRVYERYSMIGGNRVSLNITLLGIGTELFLTAISSGGSQAVLFKINTFGEEAFLSCIADVVNNYQPRKQSFMTTENA
jgi:hypothetical protein